MQKRHQWRVRSPFWTAVEFPTTKPRTRTSEWVSGGSDGLDSASGVDSRLRSTKVSDPHPSSRGLLVHKYPSGGIDTTHVASRFGSGAQSERSNSTVTQPRKPGATSTTLEVRV